MENNLTVPEQTLPPENSTNATFTRNEELARVEVIVQSVIFVLAVLGNTTVLLSLYRKRKSLTRMHHLMMHLSLADLFVAFGSVLPQLAWDVTYVFKGGDILCRLVKYMQIVAIYASAYVLVMTAIDRYFAICLPLTSHKWSNKMVRKMVIVAWSLSLLLSVPQLFIFSYQLNTYGMYDCWGTFEPEWTLPVYITTFTVLVYIIPALILVFCYGSICIVVWKSGRVGERLEAKPRQNLYTSSDRESSSICTCLMSRSDLTSYNGIYDVSTNKESYGGKSQRFQSNSTRNSFENEQHCFNGNTVVKYSFVNETPRAIICSCVDSNNKCNVSSGKTHSLTVKENSGHITPDNLRNSKRSSLNVNGTPGNISPHSSRGSPNRSGGRRQGDHGISRAKMRTIKLTLTVVICYLACWSPFFIAQMWAVYDPTAPFYGAAYTIILLLASLNSCTNPWIYLIFSENFMSEFKQTSLMLSRLLRCKEP